MKRRPAPKHRAPRTAPRGAARAATLLTAAALVVPVLTAAPSSAAPSAGSLAANPAASGFRADHLTVTRYVTTSANVRSGPGLGYRVVGSAARGSKVTGTWSSNGWLKIGSGRYISGSLLSSSSSTSSSSTSSSTTVVRYANVASANARSGPSTGYSIVDTHPRGTRLTGTLTSNGWLKVGYRHYVSSAVLSRSAPSTSTGTTSTASYSGSSLSSDRIIAEATKYLGIMYVWAGSTPAGFDCSGYTQYVFSRLGVSLPRTVAGQRSATSYVSTPRPGDLVFWGTYHVAIYAGNGYIYDSGKPGLPVQKRKMFSGVTSFGRVNG